MMPFGRTGRHVLHAFLGLCLAFLVPVCYGSVEIELANIPVNLRKAPTTKSPIISQLPPCSRVIILESLGNWYRVKYCEHLSGYVHAALVAKPDTKGNEVGSIDELLRQQATFAFARRDWPEVVRLLDQTVLESGTGYMLGVACRELGRLDRAESAFLEGIGRLDRSWNAAGLEIHRQLLDIQQRRKRWPQVIETSKRVIDRFPSAVWAVKARAEGFLYLRKPSEAIEAYQTVLAKTPGDVEAFVGMGYARAALNDVRGAEAYFQAALGKTPANERAYLGLAELQLVARKNSEAETTLRRGIDAMPNSARLRAKLVVVENMRQAAERRAMLLARRNQMSAQQASAGIVSYRFTVVSRLRSKLYEIRLDNGSAALLQTNRSVFSGPGLHEIPLLNCGVVPVRFVPKNRNLPANTCLLKELTDVQAARYQQIVQELLAVNQALEKVAAGEVTSAS